MSCAWSSKDSRKASKMFLAGSRMRVDPCLYREMTRPRRDTRNVDWEGPALTSQGKSQLKESKRKEREKTKSPCYEFDWGLRLYWSQREAATVTAGAFA